MSSEEILARLSELVGPMNSFLVAFVVCQLAVLFVLWGQTIVTDPSPIPTSPVPPRPSADPPRQQAPTLLDDAIDVEPPKDGFDGESVPGLAPPIIEGGPSAGDKERRT